MMRISLLLQAVNRMSGPIGGAMASVRKMQSQFAGATRAAERFGIASNAAVRRFGSGIMGMYDFTRDATHHFRTLAGEEGIGRASRSIGYLKSQVSGLTGAFSLMKYASVAAGIGIGEEFVRGIIRAGGEMQQMAVTLERLQGKGKGIAAMSWMQNFGMGAGSAFSMPDIMRAYQQAQNYGMNPQGGSLAAFANLAAGERQPMNRILTAVRDAMEGVSTRPLALLGIRMRQGKGPGARDAYTYAIGNNPDITSSSANTPGSRLAEIVRIINQKYSGLASAQALTVPAGFERIRKALYLFEGNIALRKGGVFEWLSKQMNQFFGQMNKWQSNGTLDRVEASIAKFMTGAGDKVIAFVKSTDWKAVGTDLKTLGASIGAVAASAKLLSDLAGGGLTGFFNLFVVTKIAGITNAVIGLVPAFVALTTTLFGLDLAAAPITATIAIIGGLAAIGWLVYNNWDRIKSALVGSWNWIADKGQSIWKGFKDFLGNLWNGIKAFAPKSWSELIPFIATPIPYALGKLLPGWGTAPLVPAQKPLMARGAPQVGIPPLLRANGAGSKTGGDQGVQRSHFTFEFTGERANDVRVKRMDPAPGIGVDFKRGIANGGPG